MQKLINYLPIPAIFNEKFINQNKKINMSIGFSNGAKRCEL